MCGQKKAPRHGRGAEKKVQVWSREKSVLAVVLVESLHRRAIHATHGEHVPLRSVTAAWGRRSLPALRAYPAGNSSLVTIEPLLVMHCCPLQSLGCVDQHRTQRNAFRCVPQKTVTPLLLFVNTLHIVASLPCSPSLDRGMIAGEQDRRHLVVLASPPHRVRSRVDNIACGALLLE